jgi:hypothetical protein
MFVAGGPYTESVSISAHRVLWGGYASDWNSRGVGTIWLASGSDALDVVATGQVSLDNFQLTGGATGAFTYGVNNSGTLTLGNCELRGGAGTSSAALQNRGTATVRDCELDGDSGDASVGMNNSGSATLYDTHVSGGAGQAASTGLDNGLFGTVALFDSTVGGGDPVDANGAAIGVLNNGTLEGTNTLIIGSEDPVNSTTALWASGNVSLLHSLIDVGDITSEGVGVLVTGVPTVRIENSILFGGANTSILISMLGGTAELHHNVLYTASGSLLTTLGGAHDFAALEACTWTGCGSTPTGNQETNPNFEHRAEGDYHLECGSPAIDNGSASSTLPAPLFDFDGDDRDDGNGPDSGPDECISCCL